MRKTFILFSMILLTSTTTLVGQEAATMPESSSVIAEGSGLSVEAALKDAFRQAVRQAIGIMVDSETLVANAQLVQDKVLTYSGGFIVNYKKLSETNTGGIFKVRIQANVARQALAKRLEASKITVRNVDGRGMFAEAVTKLEANMSASEMLTKTLDNFPFAILDAEHPPRPQISDQNASGATVKLTVTVSPNLERYHEFAKRLDGLLSKAAISQGEFLVKYGYKSEDPHGGEYGFSGFRPSGKLGERKGMPNWIPDAYKGQFTLHEDRFFAGLTVKRTKTGDRLTSKYYQLDNSLRAPLVAAANHPVFLKVRFLDKLGEEIATERVKVENRVRRNRNFFSGSLSTAFANQSGDWAYATPGSATDASKIVWIHPVFTLAQVKDEIWYRTSLDLPVEITLSLDELKAVSSITCQLTR